MRATKLLSVSVTLWAVVVGADSASAAGNLPSLPVKPPAPNVAKPPIPNVSSGARVIMNKPVTGISSGARAIINQPVGGSLPVTGINSGARVIMNKPVSRD